MHRRHLLAAIVLAVLCGIMPGAVLAVVGLVSFEATAQPDTGKILVVWETATEMDTTGFALYRAESASPASWGDPIFSPGARGDTFTGAIYEYVDSNVTAGVTYYYQLEELTSSGASVVLGQRSAGIDVATGTPTPTATATATRTATRNPTAVPGAPATGIVLTNTPAPTATRQFTNTPASGPTGMPTPGIQPTAPPVVRPTATPLPAASVNTPTGAAPEAPATTLPEPAAPPPVETAPLAEAEAMAPTPPATAPQLAGFVTATPRPARESTPVIFESSGAQATPDPGSEGTAQSDRNTGLAWVIGGSLIGLAGLLGVILLYLRSRQA